METGKNTLKPSMFAQRFLSFKSVTGALDRIDELNQERRQIEWAMHDLANHYNDNTPKKNPVCLVVQKVNSGTMYIRWRKRSGRGKQGFFIMHDGDGKAFLQQQNKKICAMYQKYNQEAIDLTLAYSIKVTEIKRLKQYIADSQLNNFMKVSMSYE